MTLSLCIAGCGSYARTVLRDIHDMTEDVRLFFASRDVKKAKEFCETYGGAGYFGSYEEAAADPRVEAMYFCTPHHLHLEHALLAARHRKHILMEKPIARTLAEARQMVQAARDSGVKLMVAENYRFLPTMEKCRQVMSQSGIASIGQARLIQVNSESYMVPTDWRTSADLNGGGTFIDGGIHFVDILVYLAGVPERVYAVQPLQVFRQVEGEDGLVLVARLPGGAVGMVNFSRATPVTKPRVWVNVTCTGGSLSFAPYGNEVILDTPPAQRTITLPEARRGVRGMVREFRNSIREDREPRMSGEEGIKDLAVVLAAYESARLGQEVPVRL